MSKTKENGTKYWSKFFAQIYSIHCFTVQLLKDSQTFMNPQQFSSFNLYS